MPIAVHGLRITARFGPVVCFLPVNINVTIYEVAMSLLIICFACAYGVLMAEWGGLKEGLVITQPQESLAVCSRLLCNLLIKAVGTSS
jgi:hypothetical protein